MGSSSSRAGRGLPIAATLLHAIMRPRHIEPNTSRGDGDEMAAQQREATTQSNSAIDLR
jgi:hypothetical protein